MELKIQYLEHHEIDLLLWDNCISKAINQVIFAQSWYLNTVWENWTALVSTNYQYVMPLFPSRKWGIDYLWQPSLIFQSGIFSSGLLNKDIADRFLEAIPSRFRLVEIRLNILNQIGEPNGFDVFTSTSFQIDLIKKYQHTVADFSLQILQNLKIAKAAQVFVNEELDALGLVRFLSMTRKWQPNKLYSQDLPVIQRIAGKAMSHGAAKILSAYSADNRLIAAALFIGTGTKAIMLVAGQSEEGQRLNALAMIVNYFIMTFSGSIVTLDLGLSQNSEYTNLCLGFGAVQVHYPMVRKIPFPFLKGVFYP